MLLMPLRPDVAPLGKVPPRNIVWNVAQWCAGAENRPNGLGPIAISVQGLWDPVVKML